MFVRISRGMNLVQGVTQIRNKLVDRIEILMPLLADVAGDSVTSWADKEGFSRYVLGPAMLTEIVQDGRRLLSLAEKVSAEHPDHADEINDWAGSLRELISKDIVDG